MDGHSLILLPFYFWNIEFLCTYLGLLQSQRYRAHCNLEWRSNLSDELHGTCTGTRYSCSLSFMHVLILDYPTILTCIIFRNMLMTMLTSLYHVLLLMRGKLTVVLLIYDYVVYSPKKHERDLICFLFLLFGKPSF